MTYLTFLLLYVALPSLILALTLRGALADLDSKRAKRSIPLVCILALIYMTPLDNYLVYRGVWWYETDRVLATIGYVPIEDYCFFILQPILTGLLLYHVLGRYPSWSEKAPRTDQRARVIGCFLYGALTALGIALLIYGGDRLLYMGLILTWSSPLLLGLWSYGGHYIWGMLREPFLITVGIATIYLWIASWAAIMQYIRIISRNYTIGVNPLGLPVEEALFFLMTNLMIVQGVLLFLTGYRIAALRRRRFADT